MTASTHGETERKYDVDDATVLPTLRGVGEVAAVRQAVAYDLEAVYYDTAGLDLLRRRITLRRRTGGKDAGWHLKLPAQGDARTEIRLPLDTPTESGGTALSESAQSEVPPALLEPVRAIVRDRPLHAIARLRTRRLSYLLLSAGEVELAEVCDDSVTAERLIQDSETQVWREWEVELVDGGETLLDAVEEALTSAGASRSESPSKLARTLGDVVPPSGTEPSTTGPDTAPDTRPARGVDVLRTHLAQHTARLLQEDARVRADRPDSVHQLRIAARRLRSALTTYRPILVRQSTDPIREDLRWLGQGLGPARDAQVLREHLDALLADQPAELVMGPVAARIHGELGRASQAGRRQGREVLGSQRYFRLLDSLDALVESLPVRAEAHEPAEDVVARLVARDTKRLRAAVRDIGPRDEQETGEHDRALHEARKKAKRLRYAADSATPVLGRRAEKHGKAARKVQRALGRHQDAVVARATLREFAVQAHLAGENAFTFGRLHALEEWRAAEAERDFDKAWKKIRHRKVRRWLAK